MQGPVLVIYGLAPLALALLFVGLLWQRGRRGVVVLITIGVLAAAGTAGAIMRALATHGVETLAWVVIAVIALVGTVTASVGAAALHRATRHRRGQARHGGDDHRGDDDRGDDGVIDLRNDP